MKYTEIDQNRIIILQKTCNRGHSWSVTSDIGQTDGQTEIHTFFIWYPRVGREHNSPSGKNERKSIKFVYFKFDAKKVPGKSIKNTVGVTLPWGKY